MLTLRLGGLLSGDLISESFLSGDLLSRATDFGSGSALTWLKKRYRGPLNVNVV